jgi:glycosyltransferase involved in cell wall biosynthesis
MHIFGSWGYGGAELGTLGLIKALPATRFSHSICILGPQYQPAPIPSAIELHNASIKSRDRLAALRLCRILRKTRTDIAHVNNLAPWFDVALASVLAGCKCVLTFHGVEQGSFEFSASQRIRAKLSLHLSAAVTAVAESACTLLRDLLKVEGRQFVTINNGVDTDLFTPCASSAERQTVRDMIGLPQNAFVIGCVAALRPVKNHEGLLRAFREALQSSPEIADQVWLALAGDGPLRAQLQVLSRDLDIDKNIVFLGHRQDVIRILKALDVFVLNSVTEGMSYSLLEAMAVGLPTIATDVGSNPELIGDRKRGLLVPTGDGEALVKAILLAVGDRALMRSMGAEARDWIVERYSIKAMACRYAGVYEQIMGDRVRD